MVIPRTRIRIRGQSLLRSLRGRGEANDLSLVVSYQRCFWSTLLSLRFILSWVWLGYLSLHGHGMAEEVQSVQRYCNGV